MIRTLFVLILIVMLPSLSFAGSVGRISKLHGTVSVRAKKSDSFKAAKADQQLEEGDRIKTGNDGWVELRLVDNSRMTLANNTELELTSLSIGVKEKRGVLTLAGGKMRATVTKLAGQQTDFKVKSPTAVAGIKGTEFLMLSRGPANVFFGNEGTVAVAGEDGKEKPLAPQMMTQTTRGFEPVDPVKVEPESPLAQAKASFEEATATAPPAEWAAADNLPNIIARWNIKYGEYLADVGRYQEALNVYQIALDLSVLPDIQADARMGRATVFGRHLNRPDDTLEEYLRVLESPDQSQAEGALYYAGQTLHGIGKNDQAAEYLRKYLERYPDGKFRGNVETLLNTLQPPPADTK